MRRMLMFAMSVLALLALAACAGAPMSTTNEQAAQPAAPAVKLGTLTISDPWVRPANPMAPMSTAMPGATPAGDMEMGATVNTASYMVINNSGAEADALIGATVSSELVDVVELHTVVEEGGVMKMSPVEKIEVPANGEVMLKPGGFHVMMIGVKRELKAGDLVKLNLTFEKAGTVEFDAVVRPANPMP